MSLEQVKQGDRSLAEGLASELAWCSLLPDRLVNVGESWRLHGQALQTALNALDAQSGEIEMRLVRIEQDPAMKLDVAQIEGRFRGNVLALGELPAEAEGQLTVKFVPDVGLPFLRKMELKLRVDHTQRDEWQSYHITGTGASTGSRSAPFRITPALRRLTRSVRKRVLTPLPTTPRSPHQARTPSRFTVLRSHAKTPSVC